jgi:AcrR family transcriptional regulator
MDRQLTPRGEQRRQQLIGFATARFASNGYHPTSVDEIVGGLGVGKGVFYWYFSSKDELFIEILRTAQRSLRSAQNDAIRGVTDPVRRIELGIRASLEWSERNRDVYTLFQFATTDDRFTHVVSRGEEVAVRNAMRHVSEAISVGRVRNADPELVAHAILGVTTHLAREFIHKRGRPAREVADATVAFVLDGLLPGADEPPRCADTTPKRP